MVSSVERRAPGLPLRRHPDRRAGARARAGLAGAALVAALAAVVAASGAARAETPIPAAPTRWVTDHAAFLSPAATQELDARLQSYEGQTGHQVIVFTGGVPIEDWAVRAFKQWGIGHRGRDDGLALFIFSDDHHLRFEVGYGLEDRLPDARAARIIGDLMVPRIRAGDRDGAVRAGLGAALAALGGEATGAGSTPAQPVAEAPPPEENHGVGIIGVLVTLLFFFLFLRHPFLGILGLMNIGPPGWRNRGSGGGWSSGGGFSGGGGGFGGGGGGGFSGGGGSSGGGGASGSW
jgi:uncharacterized protein